MWVLVFVHVYWIHLIMLALCVYIYVHMQVMA